MSTSIPGSSFQGESSGFDSRNTEVIISDSPGDTTVRPPRPLLLQLALVERERLHRFQELSDQPPSSDNPPNLEKL